MSLLTYPNNIASIHILTYPTHIAALPHIASTTTNVDPPHSFLIPSPTGTTISLHLTSTDLHSTIPFTLPHNLQLFIRDHLLCSQQWRGGPGNAVTERLKILEFFELCGCDDVGDEYHYFLQGAIRSFAKTALAHFEREGGFTYRSDGLFTLKPSVKEQGWNDPVVEGWFVEGCTPGHSGYSKDTVLFKAPTEKAAVYAKRVADARAKSRAYKRKKKIMENEEATKKEDGTPIKIESETSEYESVEDSSDQE